MNSRGLTAQGPNYAEPERRRTRKAQDPNCANAVRCPAPFVCCAAWVVRRLCLALCGPCAFWKSALLAAQVPTACRKSDGVREVCFLNAWLNVDFDAKPASIAS